MMMNNGILKKKKKPQIVYTVVCYIQDSERHALMKARFQNLNKVLINIK